MPAALSQQEALHLPVLLRETVTALAPTDGGLYLDATFGNGGYSEAILQAAACSVMAIDRDPDAIARGAALHDRFNDRLHLRQGCFSDMQALARDLPDDVASQDAGFDGIAFDLGVCSTQIDQPERGFSFRFDGPLDMRMSKSGETAADVVMTLDETALARILWDFGEERASRRIARAIVKARSTAHFRPPSDLRVLAPLGPAVAALRSNGYVDRFPKAISSGNTFWLRTGCRLF